MARKKSVILTDGELRLMQILWDQGRASVSEVVEALPGRRAPAYNTVLTLLRILEQKGYAQHEKHGRAFIYYPVIDRNQARRSAIRRLVSQLFDDSPALLVVNILEHDQVKAQELTRLRKLLEESK